MMMPAELTASSRPFSASALVATEVGERLSVVAGAGVYFFDDGITVGAKGSLVYLIPIKENIGIPISPYVDVIFGDGMPIGIDYKP